MELLKDGKHEIGIEGKLVGLSISTDEKGSRRELILETDKEKTVFEIVLEARIESLEVDIKEKKLLLDIKL